MKSTMIAALALGLATALGGVVLKVLQVSAGNGLLITGVFLVLVGSALLVLDLAGQHDKGKN